MKRILTFLFLFSSLFASSQTQFLGAPNTTVVVKGNMKVDSILYLPKRSKTPTDTGALRYQISDSSLYVWTGNAWRKAKNDGTVTSVGLTMPSAFAVANSPVTSSGTLAVTATGTVSEYIRGDGTLGTLPSSGGGGGSGVNYYLNGSVSQGTIGGSTYYEMNKTPVIGAGTDFSRGTDGIVAQFITDSLDPNRLLIPAGAWNFELYFSASSAGGTPSFYIELFEYDGTNFTSIASSVSNPISITNGTAVSLYVASLAVPETILTATDRLAVRVSVNVSGRTITLHTEDNNLAQVITTFSGGLVSLNGLTANDQFFTTGTSGSDFNISSTSATHTFNLPTASSTVRGALSSANWTTFNNKVNISDTAAMLTNYIRHAGNGLTKTGQALSVDTASIATRARVQKAVDSLQTNINAKGSGTVTSVATGYGLSGGTITTTGTLIADTLNLSTKAWRQKGIDSVASVRVGGSGTTNRVAKFTGTSTIGDGGIVDERTSEAVRITSNGNVGVGITANNPLGSGGTFRNFMVGNGAGYGAFQGVSTATTSGSTMAAFMGGTSTASSSFKTAAYMSVELDGESSTNATGRLTFTVGQPAGAYLEAMRITSAGNVAIGNTSPSYKLDVSGTLRNTTGAAFATSSGNVLVGTTTDAGYKLDVAGTLRNTTGANFATSSGTVAVSATPSAWQSAYKVIDVGTHAYFGNTGSTSDMGNNVYNDGGWKFKNAGFGSLYRQSGGEHIFYTTQSGAQNGAVTYNIIGTMTTGARFGLGTTGPQNKMHISMTPATASLDGYRVDNATQLAVLGITGATYSNKGVGANAAILQSNTNLALLSESGGVISFHTNADEVMRVTPGGDVGIGNTAPSEKLHVTGRIRATTIDSTATGMNMLYADANGVIKKAAIPSGGSGTVTSVATGFGLSGGTITTTGTLIVDSASVATRARVQKGIDSVASLTSAKVGGTGISGYFPKWTGTSSQDTSQLFQLGRNIGIGTATPTYRIHLPDAGNVTGQAMIAGTVLGSDGNGQTIRPSGSVAMALFGQNDIGYLYGAAVSSTGRWGINTRSLNDATLSIDGSVKIVTIDSTSTARNMLYQDANGVIKKSVGLSMADDVMTPSGSWVATKDAGSGVTINNVAYTTNGTTKMVTIDGSFYIPETSWTDATWITVSTIPAGFRPSKTLNWNSSYIISGAEYERSDNTDFTGACDIAGQMRIRDDGTVQINATMNTNSIAAGGTDYIIVQFTQSYIIK